MSILWCGFVKGKAVMYSYCVFV